jgi:hypothetical protein
MVRNDDLVKGVAIGIGAALLVPVVITALVPVVKPIARSIFKAGLMVYEKGRERVEEMGEAVEDMVAEVEDELVESRESVDEDEDLVVSVAKDL